MAETADVVVVGAGVIGAGVAWRCAQRGLSVTVVDPAPGSGAAHAAAGMLAPVTELHYGERPLLGLNLESSRRYPSFVDELRDATGIDVGYRQCGTVTVAWDGADLAAIRDLHSFQCELGLDAQLLSAADVRALESGLAPGLPGGVLAAGDHQVEPSLLMDALLSAGRRAGVRFITARMVAARSSADGVSGVMLDDGTEVTAARTVIAAGAWSPLAGLPPEVTPPVRPVKGQTLHLAGGRGLLDHVVRGSVRGSSVYLVPRADGRVVVGASAEEAGYDVRPRAGAVYDLLRDAQSLVPGVGELELADVRTSLRPGSPDNAPIVGPTSLRGLILATGHYRNGVLLAPVTADGIAALVTDGALPAEWEPFGPERFTAVTEERAAAAWT